MSRMSPVAPATALCAVLAIASAPWAMDAPWLNFVFKPLTTMLIIAYAMGRGEPGTAYRRAVLAGLLFSLGGDVALMWPQQGFLPGLVSFLVAHLCYLAAFTRGARLAARPAFFVGYALVAVAILAQLWPGVPGPLRIPVLAYVAALGGMAAQAAVRWQVQRNAAQPVSRGWVDAAAATRNARVAAIGAGLFMASDAILAANKFLAPVPASALWILALYWTAQWLIASSLPARPIDFTAEPPPSPNRP